VASANPEGDQLDRPFLLDPLVCLFASPWDDTILVDPDLPQGAPYNRVVQQGNKTGIVLSLILKEVSVAIDAGHALERSSS